jgi:zinc protease
MVGAITQEKLDEQRGVVQNEKRQYENEPYGLVDEMLTRAVFPAGHPYSWTVIGSMEDLERASLADVHEWFRSYYGAANAVLSVAGDVQAADVLRRVERFFGDIPAGPPVARHQEWIAKRTGTQRQTMQDRVPQSRWIAVWNAPPWNSLEADLLDLAARVLSSGKTSRLYERLVYRDRIATGADAFLDAREIASLFRIESSARPDGDLRAVEAVILEELERFLDHGPEERELERVKTGVLAEFVRGVERIGGFGGKSDILAVHEVFGGNPAHYRVMMQRIREATPAQVLRVARDWLTDGRFILEVHPLPAHTVAATGADRSAPPVPARAQAPRFPETQSATLANGLRVIVAERRAVPVVEIALLVDAGYAADQHAHPGTTAMAMAMLDEGTPSRCSLDISEELALLGAELDAGSGLDTSAVKLSALRERLDPALALFAQVVREPVFPENELDRLREEQRAAIRREKSAPVPLALRILPRLLYGAGHAYGNPFTGSGTEAALDRIGRDDLVRFHRAWFRPNLGTMVVAGDTSLAEIVPRLEALFGDWSEDSAPRKHIGHVPPPTASSVYLVDRPGSIQSLILAGHLAPPRANPREIAIEAMNSALGGMFTSRLNMNLREDKHWAYGAGSFLPGARGQRPFLVYAPVQMDKTRDAMAEILAELRGIRDDRPPTEDELDKVKNYLTLALPGSWETAESVASALGEVIAFGLPADFHDTYARRIRDLTAADLAAAAREMLQPEAMTWVVVGDLKVIEAGIRDLGLGPAQRLDVDGNAV